jgi:hypothetical protein
MDGVPHDFQLDKNGRAASGAYYDKSQSRSASKAAALVEPQRPVTMP